jgi:threonine dehydrogenase-like Zn-dependent dehydrogenase
MKKAYLENSCFRIKRILKEEYNSIAPNEVLIEVKYASICGSDRSMVKNINSNKLSNKDVVLGHEYSGVALVAGQNVSDRIIGKSFNVQPNIHCGTCVDCLKKNYSLCKHKMSYGVSLPGGYSQLSIVKFDNLVDIGNLSLRHSSILEPVSCCIRALNKCSLRDKKNVLILGAGFTGLTMLKIINSLDYKINVDVLELSDFKRHIAKKNYARFATDNIKKFKRSYDLVIDTTGNMNVIENSIELLGKGSVYLFFGVCDQKDKIQVSPFSFWEKEISFLASRSNGHCHKAAIDFLKKNYVDDLLTHELKIEDLTNFESIFKKKNFIKGMIKYE